MASVPEGFQLIEEGSARMTAPEANEVFYNPVQVYNRDLSIAVIQTFAERRLRETFVKDEIKRLRKDAPKDAATDKPWLTAHAEDNANKIDWPQRLREAPKESGLRILDALAASGLRSIRYAKEIVGIREIVVNDLSSSAVELAKTNVGYNGLPHDLVKVQQGDAMDVMYQARREGAEKFDVIDLDPYGTAAPFLDAAVQAVSNGGLLCVTCTDLRSLIGIEYGSTYGRYRGMPSRSSKYVHEMAVRLVLQAIDDSAARYRRGMEPLLSVVPAFYLRVFVRIWDRPQMAVDAPLRRAMVLQSGFCPSFWV
mmetsp:Transcript_13549/g.50424  ORF Transcript_13549/g.50424 Transcript_13549/m.50424 type:complete len:310 (-) Transcript_13549:7-936(-)